MSFKQFVKVEEGINDKYLFKAVIVAGGAGSGKSYVVKKAFQDTGARIVNSDKFLELLLAKNSIPLKFEKGTDIAKKQHDLRMKAKELTSNKFLQYFNGMLPIIIDGTGAKFEKIKEQKEALERFGYDVSMLFVNTSLSVALKRNQLRDRTVDPEIAQNMWKRVQENMGKFQDLFGNDKFMGKF
jgi:predicted kinase